MSRVIKSYDGTLDISYVLTKQEFQAVLAGANRQITEMVIHDTSTFLDQILTADDIHKASRNKGYDGIKYHFVITREGSLQRGAHIDDLLQHAGLDHQQYSISLAFVGGINLNMEEAKQYGGYERVSSDVRYANAEGFTPAQWKTFDVVVKSFYQVFPYGQIFGHKDIISSGVIDPGFDVQSYIQKKFNKVNIIDPNQPSKSLDELLTEALQ